MTEVRTPDGYGQVLSTQSAHGRTSYLVEGAGFKGWYDGLEVTADFADQPEDVIPNHENNTALPYTSRPQGPGWDGTTSTIQPDIDPHLQIGGTSDSLTGQSTDEDPVEADIEGLFEPHSRLAGARVHMLHNATDGAILNVTTLPEDSPTDLENSPLNPDGVDTDDLFNGSLPHFERESAAIYDSLTLRDEFSFMRYASDDDEEKKKNHHERGADYPSDSDDDSDDDGDSDSDSSDSSSDGGDSSSVGSSGGNSSGSSGGHISSVVDLHFLANLCSCASVLPLHSKSEHRELVVEAGADEVKAQDLDLEKLYERYEQENFHFQPSNLRNLVERPSDDGDSADLYNKLASAKTAAPAEAPQPTQIESQIEQLMQFWAVDNNGWWHWTGSQADLALLNQMQQQMTAVGMPGGPPGQMQAQSAVSFQIEENTPSQWRKYLQTIASDRLVALAAWKDVVQKSKRLRREGAISWEMFKPEVATAYVQGDHGKYYTTVQRLGSFQGAGRQLTTAQVSGWSCECEWGQWAWLRKRSFVGRMCSHAYALFSEAQSLDWKARLDKGKPIKISSVGNKASWTRRGEGFEWVSNDSWAPTAAIEKTASGWNAQVWTDGLAEDSYSLGSFSHSEQARRAVARVITAHLKFAADGDVDVVGGDDSATFQPYAAPDSISGGGDNDPYSEDGAPEDLLAQERQEGSAGIQEGTTRVGFSVFAEHDDGQDDEDSDQASDGIEESDPDDEESLDEEIAEDEGDSGSDGEDSEPVSTIDDGGHDEPHQRDDSDDDEGTDNPGDESDDDGIEKQSTVAELQSRYGLTHLAGANYSLAEQDKLVREGEGKTARNRGDLNLTGTHYEAAATSGDTPEDTLAFLF